MAKYHQTAPEIGKEVNDFCNENNLNPEQRASLLRLMFGSTRIASGGRLQFSTRVNSYAIIARQVDGVKSVPKKVTKPAYGRYPESTYDSVGFEVEPEPEPPVD
ncbi:MAG: hypothetical protein DWQ49_09440 [Bacteroidetes bacterium]|nr:MAG: hypothetical protein DWQ49_09440 [Bacteroidota bacterium]